MYSQESIVTFNANSGSLVQNQAVVRTGETVTEPEVTKNGYTLEAGTRKQVLRTSRITTTGIVNASTTLHTKWTTLPGTYAVIFNADAGRCTKLATPLATGTGKRALLPCGISPPTDSESGGNNEKPVHSVTISAFPMNKYEVTQKLYETVMGSNPSRFTPAKSNDPEPGETNGKRPVETVSRHDAVVFCNRLSMSEGLTPVYTIGSSTAPGDWGPVPAAAAEWNKAVCNWTANGYQLPAEAEWEYAA